MGIDITEIAQKVLDNNKNAANVFRKMYDLHYNPNPLDVPFEYVDENGNKLTTNIKNVAGFRKKLWDDVGGALGQFNRTFYVDAVNGDDNNTGTIDSPFKTIKKAIDSVPIGGMGTIYLKDDQTHIVSGLGFYVKNKTIIIKRSGDGNNSPTLQIKSWISGDYNYYVSFQGINYSIYFYNINIEDYKTDSSLNDNIGWGIFGRESLGDIKLVFMECSLNIQYAKLLSASNNLKWIDISFNSCDCTFPQKTQITLDYGALANINSYNTTYNDGNGNSINLVDIVYGVVKDTNGVPRNIISNIVF